MPWKKAAADARKTAAEQAGKATPLSANDWANAVTDVIRQDDVRISILSVAVGQLPNKGMTPFVLIRFRLTNEGNERTIPFEGFSVENHLPTLTDETGRKYAFVEQRPRKPAAGPPIYEVAPAKVVDLKPGAYLDTLLVFDSPGPGFEALKLEIPTSAWGRKGVCKFRIPEQFSSIDSKK